MACVPHARERLLEHPVRARILERVLANPGVHRAELVEFAGIGQGATRHHLDRLVKGRLLVEAREAGFVRYFVAGHLPPEAARREAVLRAGSNRRVFEALVAEPHLTLRELGARLGITAPSVHRSVKRLRAAGLLPPTPVRASVRPAAEGAAAEPPAGGPRATG